MLLIRELVVGSQRFNDLRRGLPRMSPTLLSKRLRQLVAAGLVQRRGSGTDQRYTLTPAGRELGPIVEALGAWGVRWVGKLGDEDLDPKLLLWDMHRNIDHEAAPSGRSVIQFEFSDVPRAASGWWLVITSNEVDVCDADPGFPVSVTVQTSLRRMTEIWRGDVTWAAALRDGTLVLHGPTAMRRALPRWFLLPAYAAVSRPA